MMTMHRMLVQCLLHELEFMFHMTGPDTVLWKTANNKHKQQMSDAVDCSIRSPVKDMHKILH